MLDLQQLQVYQVKLPLPFRLNHVNCYAIRGSNGWTLLDSGLNYPATQEAWQKFFAEQQIQPKDITGIYLTHFHPDHYGAAGWLQQLTGAPIYLGAVDYQRVNAYWKNPQQTLGSLDQLFTEHGMPGEIVSGVIEAMAKLIPLTVPHGEVTTLEAGQLVGLGDHDYQVLHTPGHTDGHMCFYNARNKILFSGDHLLPKITSNISLWHQPEAEPDPLSCFINSLKQIGELECQLVFPAHGEPFAAMGERVEQLLEHHQERLAIMEAAVGSGHTGWEVCKQVFSPKLSMHELRFAMAETLAHLMHLVYAGRLELTRNGEQWRFAQKS